MEKGLDQLLHLQLERQRTGEALAASARKYWRAAELTDRCALELRDMVRRLGNGVPTQSELQTMVREHWVPAAEAFRDLPLAGAGRGPIGREGGHAVAHELFIDLVDRRRRRREIVRDLQQTFNRLGNQAQTTVDELDSIAEWLHRVGRNTAVKAQKHGIEVATPARRKPPGSDASPSAVCADDAASAEPDYSQHLVRLLHVQTFLGGVEGKLPRRQLEPHLPSPVWKKRRAAPLYRFGDLLGALASAAGRPVSKKAPTPWMISHLHDPDWTPDWHETSKTRPA